MELINLLAVRGNVASAGVNRLTVIFGRMRAEQSQEVHGLPPASCHIILGCRTEACEPNPAFNTPLKTEGHLAAGNPAAKLGNIQTTCVLRGCTQKGPPVELLGSHIYTTVTARLTRRSGWVMPSFMASGISC